MEIVRANFRITINKKTLWIECETWDGGQSFHSLRYVALARVGRGLKLWPCRVRIWRDRQTGIYRESMSSVHLNRPATIVNWNSEELARYTSKHNSATGLAPGWAELR